MALLTASILVPAALAQTETVLYNFQYLDGAVPNSALVLDSQGNIFGTTSMGGAFDSGTIFEVTPPRTESVLYNFTGGADGFHPYGGLIRDSQGNYYGTTFQGGIAGSGCNFGCGVVFKLAANGTETVLYDFAGGADGSGPIAGLVLDGQGNLYGTTVGGGNLTCPGTGCGVVFKIPAAGGETVLYSFLGGSEGARPQSSLILDGQGNLYGTTYEGGGSNCNGLGCGTVFKISATGEETVLYRFSGGTDGGTPLAGLVMDSQGNLYGTTGAGGFAGNGVVFKITQ